MVCAILKTKRKREHPNAGKTVGHSADRNPTSREGAIRNESNTKSRSHGNRACRRKTSPRVSAARPLHLFLLFLRLWRSRGFRLIRFFDDHNIFQPHVIAIHDNVCSDPVFR